MAVTVFSFIMKTNHSLLAIFRAPARVWQIMSGTVFRTQSLLYELLRNIPGDIPKGNAPEKNGPGHLLNPAKHPPDAHTLIGILLGPEWENKRAVRNFEITRDNLAMIHAAINSNSVALKTKSRILSKAFKVPKLSGLGIMIVFSSTELTDRRHAAIYRGAKIAQKALKKSGEFPLLEDISHISHELTSTLY